MAGNRRTSGFGISVFDSIKLVSPDVWNKVNINNDIFLHTDYFEALENAPPDNMAFRYAVFHENGIPAAIIYFQLLKLDAGLHGPPEACHKEGVTGWNNCQGNMPGSLHKKIMKHVSSRMLVCGNMLLSGEHGFSAVPEIDRQRLYLGLSETIGKIARDEKAGGKVNAVMVKDFSTGGKSGGGIFLNSGYYRYSAGPNMVVPIRDSWKTFDDYLSGMKSKYRGRINNALKKGRDIGRKRLSHDEIVSNADVLYGLYLQVAEKAKFRMFILNPALFGELKRLLKDRFILEAYCLDGRIVAFTTRIFNGDVMEGYSHGLDYSLCKEYCIYQNIMLDDIKTAIGGKIRKVNMGRTSAAMKSSLGAVPEDMEFYMQFKIIIPNAIIKTVSNLFKPADEYCRNPFGQAAD